MATGVDNRHKTRQVPWNVVQELRIPINFNDAGIASGIGVETFLPAGAEIILTKVKILTTFSQAGLTVGQNASSYNDIVADGDVDETTTTPAATIVFRGADLNFSNDTQIFYKYTGTATQGKAVVIILFVPDFAQQ